MSDDLAEELRALRARAYGPAADIGDDPQALERLRVLEALAMGRPPGEAPGPDGRPGAGDAARSGAGAATGSGPGAAPGGAGPMGAAGSGAAPGGTGPVGAGGPGPDAALGAAAGTDAARGAPPEGSGPRAPAAPGTFRWERHRASIWAASLVVAALVGAGVVGLQPSPGPSRVAVLEVEADGSWPEQMWGPRPPDGATFEEFSGLTAIASRRDFGNSTDSTCLWVYETGSVNFGLSAGACAADAFPVSASVPVTSRAPAPLRERFAEGTVLQFVLDDDVVTVYADEP